ncbi:glycosyltransferase [Mesorhizobium sp. WSM2239]|uniref:Glycosyltransferase n=2 Tax=unclassified Mesorhizobium TaxID=325217 RepID=A0AAU8DIL5_9HYPH
MIEELDIPWLTGDDAVTCDVLFANHPQVFERMPDRPVRIRPRHVVCVVQHPLFDGAWIPQYDLGAVERNLERLFGAPVTFAPVGPKVRAQFEILVGWKPKLLPRDLFNMIDISEWSCRIRPPPQGSAILGRHSRPARLKWPDSREELLAAYPDKRHLTVKALGGVPSEIQPWLGSNWQLLPFSEDGTAEFLKSLDFYVYFHSRLWVEAFGIGIAEAMASGVVTILDPSYEALYGDGAVYTEANGVETVIDCLLSSPDAYLKQSAAARKLVEAKFSLAIYPKRMAVLYEALELPPIPALKAAKSSRASRKHASHGGLQTSRRSASPCRIGVSRRVLFVATNGIGLGHITRLMAIAERMSPDIEPIFITRSAGSSLISQRGHATDYIPWPVKIGVTDNSWNQVYSQELLVAIESFDIAAVVFDGTYPFPGLVDVAGVRPDIAWIWVRRAMWRTDHSLKSELQSCFDMIIEPGELAHDEDYGPTRSMPGPITVVGPILLKEPGCFLSRSDAAKRLGMDPEKFTAAIQLGSQRNFDYETLPELLTKELLDRHVQLVQIDNPLSRPPVSELPGVIRRRVYPVSEYLGAVDLMITNASYNSFHECVYGGIPAIFVPNESPEMDDQHLRATYAHATGLGLRIRASELSRVKTVVDTAMSNDFRQEMRRRSARLDFVNGAVEAARAIEQLVFSVRANRPLHESLART